MSSSAANRAGGSFGATLVRNFSTSSGTPSARRSRWPIGVSTSTRSVRVPSLKRHLHGVADVALVEIVVVPRELGFSTTRIFARSASMRGSRGHGVVVVGGREPAEDQRHGGHVLQAVVAVGRVGQRARLVDDPHARLLRFDEHRLDVVEPIAHGGCSRIAASTAVWAWNSAGYEILNSTFSIT